ncbi:MAG: ATP-grasp domain-containing protein [Bacteroidales bacterium]|nr:ATP-grasp domain-containing protein [Bacteroidales bacterium]
MANVLLLGSGTQSLAILPSLHKAGHRVVMLTEEHSNYGDRSRYVTKVYRHHCDNDEGAYMHLLSSIVASEAIDVVIPMGDDGARLMSKHRDALMPRVKSPAFGDFLRGYDKNQLMTLCREKGYPHPATIDLAITAHDSDEVKHFAFPAMLKPNCTTGGRGMVVVNSYEEFEAAYPALHATYGDYHLQKFVKEGGKQVKVQLYVNDRQELVASSVMQKLRWYPVKAGSNCCAVSIRHERMVEICHSVLKDLNWVGFADFDLIEDPDTGQLLIMEINPRLPACIKNAIVAGIDWAEIMVRDVMQQPQKQYTFKEGVYLRHLGLEILWWKNSASRWHTKPCWWKFWGNVRYQDMSTPTDPMPFLSGTYNNIKKLFNPDFQKAKQI